MRLGDGRLFWKISCLLSRGDEWNERFATTTILTSNQDRWIEGASVAQHRVKAALQRSTMAFEVASGWPGDEDEVQRNGEGLGR